MVDYTDLIAPVAPDGSCAAFKVAAVKMVNVPDPKDQNPKKGERKKVQALRVEYSLLLATGEESTLSDLIYITRDGVQKLDRLRTATGEEIKTRVFDETTLVDKTGFVELTLAGQPARNYIAKYLTVSDGEDLFAEQVEKAEQVEQGLVSV